jgi:hypothetical protein
METIPLFLLNTVLFPGGLLSLQVFEQRYLDLAKECLRENRPFGVCLIREGAEVGAPAIPHDVGCTARIASWDMPRLGILDVGAEGVARFRIARRWTEKSGLVRAEIEILASVGPTPIPPEQRMATRLLEAVIASVDHPVHAGEAHYDDAEWVADRLSDLMPFDLPEKQRLLELTDPVERLGVVMRRVEALAAAAG